MISPTTEKVRAALRSRLDYLPGGFIAPPAFTYKPPFLPDPTIAQLAENYDTPWPRRRIGTLRGVEQALEAGMVTALEVVSTIFENIKRYDSRFAVFVSLAEEDVRIQARELDRRRHRGETNGPLDATPISIKDIIHAAGFPTTASSSVPFDAATLEEAPAVSALRAAGALILGKTHTHEFALGVTQPQSTNPWDPTRVPGGSSGGAAISLVAGMCLGALGTDTRASIRVPAALCGTVGFKPTYGLVSTRGLIPLSWSMDHCAPMARTVEDVALLADILILATRESGPCQWHPPKLLDCARKVVRGLRVGVPDAGLVGSAPEVERAFVQAVSVLEAEGVEITVLNVPSLSDLDTANAMGMIVSRCEAAAVHELSLGTYANLYGPDVHDQLRAMEDVKAIDYLQAQRYRAELVDRMARILADVDALALPTTLIPAPHKADAESYLMQLSRNCTTWSFIGFPAISIPCGLTSTGLPVGFQLVSKPFNDGVVIALAAAVERSEHLDERFYSCLPAPWRLSTLVPQWA